MTHHGGSTSVTKDGNPAGALERRLRGLLGGARSPEEGIREAVEAIAASSDRYHWTGIYLLEDRELVLAHQVGPPTPHARIPLDKGICGAAAREGATIVVDDVNADPRYLACSLRTRSEIVVPLKAGGRVLGEIDIDSDEPAAFTEDERRALEAAAACISEFLDRPSRPTRPAARPAPSAGARSGRPAP